MIAVCFSVCVKSLFTSISCGTLCYLVNNSISEDTIPRANNSFVYGFLNILILNSFDLHSFNLYYRYKRFEKAFLLAVDIGAKDLFMVSHMYLYFYTCYHILQNVAI